MIRRRRDPETLSAARTSVRVVTLPVRRTARFSRRHWPILLALLGVLIVLAGYLAQTMLSQRRASDVAVLGSVVRDQNTALASNGLPTVNPSTVVAGVGDLPSTTTTTVTVRPSSLPTGAPLPVPTVTATVVLPGRGGAPVTTTITGTPGSPVTLPAAPGMPAVTITLPPRTSTVTVTTTATATETATTTVTTTTTATETTTATTTETTTAPAPPPETVTVTEPAPPPVTVTETQTVTAEPPPPDPPASDPEVSP